MNMAVSFLGGILEIIKCHFLIDQNKNEILHNDATSQQGGFLNERLNRISDYYR